MHIGYNNGEAKYEMNGKYLEVIEERDFGVIMQSDLKCKQAYSMKTTWRNWKMKWDE